MQMWFPCGKPLVRDRVEPHARQIAVAWTLHGFRRLAGEGTVARLLCIHRPCAKPGRCVSLGLIRSVCLATSVIGLIGFQRFWSSAKAGQEEPKWKAFSSF